MLRRKIQPCHYLGHFFFLPKTPKLLNRIVTEFLPGAKSCSQLLFYIFTSDEVDTLMTVIIYGLVNAAKIWQQPVVLTSVAGEYIPLSIFRCKVSWFQKIQGNRLNNIPARN